MASKNVGFHQIPASKMFNDDSLYSFDQSATPKKSGNGPMKTPAAIRMATSMAANSGSGRPMTSNRAAGYSSRGRTSGGPQAVFDPFNQAKAVDARRTENPEDQFKAIEKKVNQLVQDSVMAAAEANPILALDKAKEATKRERALTKQREQMEASMNSLNNQSTPSTLTAPNLDLTYCVMLNLASCYHQSKMYQEAINTYSAIAKNKQFNQSGRLRVNMGNIHFEQQKYSQAIKMYRMALDQIPNTNMDIRYLLIL
jgi:intraflagellar transport protein 88